MNMMVQKLNESICYLNQTIVTGRNVYPMLFMERFWRGEPKKELFVAMPFHKKLKPRFSEIIKPAAKKIGEESQ